MFNKKYYSSSANYSYYGGGGGGGGGNENYIFIPFLMSLYLYSSYKK